MIRAGRRDKVLTVAGLAKQLGLSEGTVRNTKPYTAAGHPAPISSASAQTLLWDSEQITAYYAGEPVPQLPEEGPQDLLDRHEAAAEAGVAVNTWNGYKRDPAIADHLVVVAGVEHWPREVVRAFQQSRSSARPKPSGGRPRGSGDAVPRTEIASRVADLLTDAPAISAAQVARELGIAYTTALNALATARGQRISDVVREDPGLTPAQAAERLGYPRTGLHRALAAAEGQEQGRGRTDENPPDSTPQKS
ncbi:hypothetical protein ACTWQF_34250 [Streptomyces sp. 8N114]|uniref:hypothetical protein n=1 Tax=Streptomyces sp. 8N114 TaxID=3457419 RepID=UPI003FCFB0B3